jgi:hypothetical protein
MAALTEVFVDVKPETKDFGRDLNQKLKRVDTKDAGRHMGLGMSKNFGGGFRAGLFGSAKRMFAPIVAAAAAVGGIAFFKDAIGQASDLNETVSKVGQIFGKQGPALQSFAKTANTALGQTQQQALDAAATFGVFGKAAGLSGKDLTGFSTQMVTLSADLASFSNTSPEEAIEAIGSALRGESEPIRKYGVLLDDATLRNRALKLGLIDSVKTGLTPQQKALAAQAEILAQTKDAQGDFARTSDGLANKQRILAATFSDVKTRIGAVLLPAMSGIVSFIADKGVPVFEKFGQGLSALFAAFREGDVTSDGFVGVMERIGVAARQSFDYFKTNILPRLKEFAGFLKDEVVPRLISFGGWVKDNAGLVKGLAIAMGALVAVTKIHGAVLAVQAAGGLVAYIRNIKIVQAATRTWAAVQWLLNAALTANPIGIVIVAVAALVAAIVVAWQKSEKFRDIVKGVWQAVQDKVGAVVGWIKTTWGTFWEGLKLVAREGLRRVIDGFLGFVDKILQGAEQAFGWVPELGDKLDDAHDAFSDFRRGVNNELGAISDEDIKVNVKTYGNLEFGGAGGRGGAGISMGVGGAGPLPGVMSHASQAMGGALDIKTLGLDASKISDLATDFVGQTKAAVQKQITKAFESGTMGPAGFPLPRGRYRVGRGTVGHGYPAVDFPAAMGTPIYAVRSGVVSAARRLATSYGIHSILGHPGGWGSLYAHMSQMFVRSGQFVRAGQQIGRVGSTGNSTGPHLHFEARRNGVRVNPRSLISYANGGIIGEHVLGLGMQSGRQYQFGERGPETVTPGRGVGNTYNINVTVPLGAQASGVGEEIVRQLQNYERRNGQGWRS